MEISDKKKIFGIGASGLVGSKVLEFLKDKYTCINLSTSAGVDITNYATLEQLADDESKHAIVLHFAAKTNVDDCEEDKALGTEGDAWKINVRGTENVINACKKSQKKIIYISTDFVFDGENTPQNGYTEDVTPHPINWYAETKFQGEERLKNSGLPFLIIRISYPFRKQFDHKKDFLRAILQRLQNGERVTAITDHIMTPTYIDDIAYALDTLIAKDATGIYHVVGSTFVSPFDAAIQIAQAFHLDTSLIGKTTREEFFKNRAPRPFNLSVNNDKIEKLGIRMKTFEEALEKMKI